MVLMLCNYSFSERRHQAYATSTHGMHPCYKASHSLLYIYFLKVWSVVLILSSSKSFLVTAAQFAK